MRPQELFKKIQPQERQSWDNRCFKSEILVIFQIRQLQEKFVKTTLFLPKVVVWTSRWWILWKDAWTLQQKTLWGCLITKVISAQGETESVGKFPLRNGIHLSSNFTLRPHWNSPSLLKKHDDSYPCSPLAPGWRGTRGLLVGGSTINIIWNTLTIPRCWAPHTQ